MFKLFSRNKKVYSLFFFFKQQIVTTENVIIDTVPVKIQISSFNLLWIVFITWNRKNKRTKKKKLDSITIEITKMYENRVIF